VEVVLTRKSSALSFNKETETIELIPARQTGGEAKAEAEASFTFDVERNTLLSKKDTVEFMITDGSGIMIMKQFIFSYTGPKEFKLEQNYPNPFNPTTTIQYQIPASPKSSPKERTSVTLKVYDILGSEVATLVNEEQEAGYKEVQFNGSNFASGMYVYRIQAGEYISSKKMMLLK
jgi:hypothetical protein